VPIQVKSSLLNLAAGLPMTGSIGLGRDIMPKVRPSRGTCEYIAFDITMPPAPGMFFTTMLGSPAM
jgi:hypothetical protein